MKIILLGAPGAGKGTQAESIKAKYPVAHISTGSMLRINVKQGTELGKTAKEYMDAGKLVPDDVIIPMMEQRLCEDDAKDCFILDGFPRNVAQAASLDEMLEKLGIKLDAVVNLVIDDEVVVSRLTSRRICRQCGKIYNLSLKPTAKEGLCDHCGGEVVQRDDDREDVIRRRLAVFHEQSVPLMDYYRKRGLLFDVDATGGRDVVLKLIEQLRAGQQ